MPRSIKFIHAADLHIGAPFRGVAQLSDVWAKRLSTAIREAFCRIVDEAISRSVDFLIIAGDTFDTSRASYADYLFFFDCLHKLQKEGIEVYMVCGNHDPYTSWKDSEFLLPENTHMFPAEKPGFKLFQRNGVPLCIIGGTSYYNQTWPKSKHIASGISRHAGVEALESEGFSASEAPFCVGVVHTGLHLDLVKAPEKPVELLQRNVDYWACGHIHKQYVHKDATGIPRIVFPGCIQGRDIRETKKRGVFCVEIAEGSHVSLDFIPTASVVWQQISVDVSDCLSIRDVSDLILRKLFSENGEAQCEEMVSRITLVGKTPLHKLLIKPGVLEEVRNSLNDTYPKFFCDTMINETKQIRDRTALKKEGLFPAVLMNVAGLQKQNLQETTEFLEDEFLQRNTSLHKKIRKDILALQDEAEELVLDTLQQGVK